MHLANWTKKWLLLTCVLAISINRGEASALASWFFRGQTLSDNYTQLLDLDDTLVIQCKAYGNAVLASAEQIDNQVNAFVVTVNAPPTKIYSTVPTSGTPQLTVDAGTLVYDSINGNAQQFPHFLADVSMSVYGTTSYASSGILSILVPHVSATDTGTFYCAYADGSADSNDPESGAVAHSSPFTLNVRTIRGSRSAKSVVNREMQYTLALLAVSKIVF